MSSEGSLEASTPVILWPFRCIVYCDKNGEFCARKCFEPTGVCVCAESRSLEQVLMTIIQGAVDIPDPTGQKSCFSILKKLIEVWGEGTPALSSFQCHASLLKRYFFPLILLE